MSSENLNRPGMKRATESSDSAVLFFIGRLPESGNQESTEGVMKMDDRMQAKIESGEADFIELPALLSTEGKSYIERLILSDLSARFSEIDKYREWRDFARFSVNMDLIFEGIELVNNRGKIAKRIKRNLRRLHGISLDDSLISEIGNQARNHSTEGSYIVEISGDSIEHIGHFCDSHSCFREGEENYHMNQAISESADYGILLIYNESGERIARALICNEWQSPIIFNAYGMRLNQVAEIYSQVIKNSESRVVSFYSDLWINSGHGITWDNDEKSEFNTVIDLTEFGDYCHECADRINSDIYIINGDHFCRYCHDQRMTYCESCEDYHDSHSVDFYTVKYRAWNNSTYTRSICEFCAELNYFQCSECGDFWPESEAIQNGESGDHFCGDCIVKIAAKNGVIYFEKSRCKECENRKESAAIYSYQVSDSANQQRLI